MLPDFDWVGRIGSYWGTQDPHLRRATVRLRGGRKGP